METNKEKEETKVKQKNQTIPRLQHTTVIPRNINLNTQAGQDRFRTVCEELWTVLYSQDCAARNYPYYHSCCSTFSKKKYAAGDHKHPGESTHRFTDWIKQNGIKDTVTFHQFLLEQTEKKPAHLQMVPGLNLPHEHDALVTNTLKDNQDRLSELEKRNQQLQAALDASNQELKASLEENRKLKEQLQQEVKARKDAEFSLHLTDMIQRTERSKVQFANKLDSAYDKKK